VIVATSITVGEVEFLVLVVGLIIKEMIPRDFLMFRKYSYLEENQDEDKMKIAEYGYLIVKWMEMAMAMAMEIEMAVAMVVVALVVVLVVVVVVEHLGYEVKLCFHSLE